MRFSKSIGVEDSNIAELLAIREGLILFLSSPWAQCKELIIESDSKIAINWVNNPESAPWRIRKFVTHMETLKPRVIGLTFVHVFREVNQIVDQLAKEGVRRTSNLFLINNG
ncbi:hypothetical protein PTKIN_Ptkin16aG0022400 [Pterospermum kingtungense]